MRVLAIASGLVLALSGGVAFAEATATPAAATAAPAAYSTSSSTMGTLVANPATKAVLVKALPEFMEKMGENPDRVSGMTLKELQDTLKAYAPDLLSDAKLAAIDLELAKVPAAN